MPFRSEKRKEDGYGFIDQILREDGAHHYPNSNRGLPMYCHTKIKSGKNKGRICGRKKCRIHH